MTALNLAKQFNNQDVIGLLQSASVQLGAAKSQAVAQ